MAAELHQEGLKFLLEAALLETQAVPANFYIGLATDASLAENATLASLTEVSGTGYSRQAIASSAVGFPTSQTAGTYDWQVVTAQVTFTAGGDWSGANTAFLCSSSDGSGKLIASAPLAGTRTLHNTDTEKVTLTIQLNG